MLFRGKNLVLQASAVRIEFGALFSPQALFIGLVWAGRGIWERASLSHEKKCQKKISRIIRDLLRLSRPRNEACQVRTLNILYGCFLVSIK